MSFNSSAAKSFATSAFSPFTGPANNNNWSFNFFGPYSRNGNSGNKASSNTQNVRTFSDKAGKMATTAYFECEWFGPVVEVDSKGTVTSTGNEPKGSFEDERTRLSSG